jgi:hypothetical protein
MLRLDDAMLAQVKAAAAPIPVKLREGYLQRVAAALNGRKVTMGEVQCACQQAQAHTLHPHASLRYHFRGFPTQQVLQ